MRQTMKLLVLGCLFAAVAATAAAEPVFVIQFTLTNNYDVENVTVDVLNNSVKTPGNGIGNHRLQITAQDGNILYEEDVSVMFERHLGYPRPDDDGIVEHESIRFFARLPYDETAEQLQLYDEDRNLRATVNLPDHACPPEPDGECLDYCDDRDLAPACSDMTRDDIPWFWVIIVLALAGGIASGTYVYRRRKQQERARQLQQSRRQQEHRNRRRR